MDTEIEPDTSHIVDRKDTIAKIRIEGFSRKIGDTESTRPKDAEDGYNFEVPILDPVNIKKEVEEEEEEVLQNGEEETPDDASSSKAANFEGGECSYAEWIPHQFLSIEMDPATKNDKTPPPNKRKTITNEAELKQTILNQEIVARVALRREDFHLRNFVCDICYNVFAFSRSLKMHQPVHKNAKRRTGSTTTNNKPIQVHFHLSRRILKCDRCEFKCDNIIALKMHKIQHMDERPFVCDQCDFKCRYSAHLKLHKFKHIRGTPFNCQHCQYKTAQSSHFKAHMLSHTGEKPLQCDKCDYKCAYSSSLKFHKASHSAEKPYRCEQCYYQTAHRDYLKRHMMTHSGEKPYHCDQCDYKAIRSSHLKTHRLTHTGEKPYVCDHCDSKYACMKSLKRHRLLHSDLKL